MPSPCIHCGKPIPDTVPKCPFCGKFKAGATVPSNVAAAAKPPEDKLKFDPTPLLASDIERPVWERLPKGLHAALLMGALPLIVPSLVVTRIQARRWGRVPISMIVFDGILFLAFAFTLPRVLPFLLVAMVCTATLAVLRARFLNQGIYLGYSTLVTSGLILSGVLTVVGAFSTFSFTEMRSAAVGEKAVDVTSDAIARNEVDLGQRVRVRQPLLWNERVWKVSAAGGFVLVAAADQPRDATGLWAPFQEGEGDVWATLPLGATEPRRIEGWLRAPTAEEAGALLDNWKRTHVGGKFKGTFSIVATQEVGQPSAPVKAVPVRRDPAGIAALLIGLLIAVGSVFKAVNDDE